MAYIPDQAFDDKNEVGQKAFDLYVFYCKHGAMDNNRVQVSLDAAANFFGIAYENICRINAVLKKKDWIVLDAGDTVLLKGWEVEKVNFKSRKNRQKLTKTSEIDPSTTDESISFQTDEMSKTDENISFKQSEESKTDENISFLPENPEKQMSKTDESISFLPDGECQKLTFSSVSPLEPLKGYINYSEPALLKPILERENKNAQARARGFPEFDPFPETEKLVDEEFRRIVDETLFWIQTDKQLSRRNFPAKEWLDCIEKLQPDGILCTNPGDGGFRDFYEWAGSEDWVETVTPKLLLNQIEKYKKRDIIAQKRKRTGGKNEHGNSNGHNNRAGSNSGQAKNGVQSSRRGHSETTQESLARTNAKPKSVLR